MIDEFKVYLSSRQIQPGIAEWSQNRAWITNRLREEIVTQAQGVAKGDEVQMQSDPQVQAAVKALDDHAILAKK